MKTFLTVFLLTAFIGPEPKLLETYLDHVWKFLSDGTLAGRDFGMARKSSLRFFLIFPFYPTLTATNSRIFHHANPS